MSFFPTAGRTCIVVFLLFCSFYAQQASAQTRQRIWFSLTAPNDVYNETSISFNPNATDGLDSLYDTQIRTYTPELEIFSKLAGSPYNFREQTLSELTTEKTVMLGINANIPGFYRLQLGNLQNIDESVIIILEDILTGTFQNLRNEPLYIFALTTGNDIQRIKIHFYAPFNVTSTNFTCAGSPGVVHLSQPGAYTWNYEIVDEANIVVDSGVVSGTKTVDHLNAGAYTIYLQDDYGYTLTRQVTLEGKEQVAAQFEVSEEVLQAGEPLHVYDYSVGASSLSWNFGDGTVINNDAFPTHHFMHPGEYEVILTASNADCQETYSKTIQVGDIASGVGTTQDEVARFYAAGTDLVLDVPLSFNAAQVQVFNLLGQAVHSENITTGDHRISLSEKCQFCIVQIVGANGSFASGKVFIQE